MATTYHCDKCGRATETWWTLAAQIHLPHGHPTAKPEAYMDGAIFSISSDELCADCYSELESDLVALLRILIKPTNPMSVRDKRPPKPE